MKSPESIGWQEAQKWAEAHGQQRIVILCASDDPNTTHVLTWGATVAQSAEAAETGNRLKDIVWPQYGPHNDYPEWLVGLIEVYNAAKHVDCENELVIAKNKWRAAIESKLGK